MEENLKIEKMLKMNGLPSLVCSVRYAHTTNQTPRQKMAHTIIQLCPPTTQSKRISVRKSGKWLTYHIEHKFVEKYLKMQSINSEKIISFFYKFNQVFIKNPC